MKIIKAGLVILSILMLASCGNALKIARINEHMSKNITFNAPAGKVYTAAVAHFRSKLVTIGSIGRNQGVSTWLIAFSGEKDTMVQSRIVVAVNDLGDGSSQLDVRLESNNVVEGRVGSIKQTRLYADEFIILKRVNPEQGEEIDNAAI